MPARTDVPSGRPSVRAPPSTAHPRSSRSQLAGGAGELQFAADQLAELGAATG
ncbi:MAG: hypothetical protein LW854_05600 [Rubrivivax sp.]|nr:hypothetical protein [Rubrivivax sp.]